MCTAKHNCRQVVLVVGRQQGDAWRQPHALTRCVYVCQHVCLSSALVCVHITTFTVVALARPAVTLCLSCLGVWWLCFVGTATMKVLAVAPAEAVTSHHRRRLPVAPPSPATIATNIYSVHCAWCTWCSWCTVGTCGAAKFASQPAGLPI